MDKKTDRFPIDVLIIATIICLSIVYAIVRYHILGPVPWKDLPIFVLNKGISLASLVLIALSLSLGPLTHLGVTVPKRFLHVRKSVGIAGLVLVLAHVLLSLVLLDPTYFPNFFDPGQRLTLFAGLALLFGILGVMAAIIHHLKLRKSGKKQLGPLLSRFNGTFLIVFGLGVYAAHVFFIGFEGWCQVGKWHAGLPPITLISFLVAFSGLIINVLGRR